MRQYELKLLIYAFILVLLLIMKYYIIDISDYLFLGFLFAVIIDVISIINRYRKLSKLLINDEETIDIDSVYQQLEQNKCESFEAEIIRCNTLKIVNEYIIENQNLNLEIEEYQDYLTMWLHETKLNTSNLSLLTKEYDNRDIDLLLENLADNIDKIIALSKSTKINTNANIKVINLNQAINFAIRSQRNNLLNAQIKVNNSISSDIFITSDEYWLQFIIRQIINNSIKYGATNISFHFKQSDQCLTIADNGIGIAPSELELVFQKYYCSHRTKKSQKSTGIGLYIVKRICNDLNHQISLTSKEQGVKVNIKF